jgi:hypothetical protein
MRATFSGMKKQPDKAPIKSLRDAYKVAGFHVRSRLDSYEHEPPAVALTLDRRSKKHLQRVREAMPQPLR